MQVWAHLSLSNIFHCEVKPHSEARVARVRPDEQIKLKFTDVVNTAQVTYGETKKQISGLESIQQLYDML